MDLSKLLAICPGFSSSAIALEINRFLLAERH
jgi:hypothetical protein